MMTTQTEGLGTTVEFGRRTMISGIAEAAERTYKRYQDDSDRLWLVAIQENAADNIYVSEPGNQKSRRHFAGFGGAALKFSLEDGSVVELHGPWHSNSEALFQATGVDVRDKHRTRVVIGTGSLYTKESGYSNGVTGCVYYEPPEGVIGTFGRHKQIAQRVAEEQGVPVYVASESPGGGCYYWQKPEGLDN